MEKKILCLVLMVLILLPVIAISQQKGNAPDNFRGIQWGTDLKTLAGFTYAGDTFTKFEGVKRYRRSEKYTVGEMNVDDIVYTFYKGKFCMGTIFFKDQKKHALLKDTLEKKYGTGTKINVDLEELQNGKMWNAGDIAIMLAYTNAKGMGRLIYQYSPIVDEWLEGNLNKHSQELDKEKIEKEKAIEKLKDNL